MEQKRKKVLVIGVIGADVHAVGNKILYHAFTEAGREKCDEAGLKGIPLLVGGNIVIGKQKFEDVEKRFKAMGFDRAFPPGTDPQVTIDALREILHMDGEEA